MHSISLTGQKKTIMMIFLSLFLYLATGFEFYVSQQLCYIYFMCVVTTNNEKLTVDSIQINTKTKRSSLKKNEIAHLCQCIDAEAD